MLLTYDPSQLVLENVQFADAALGMLCAVNTAQPGVVRSVREPAQKSGRLPAKR